MRLGSGDTKDLLQDVKSKGFRVLLNKFIANDRTHYNALASPINQFRTGAILEEVMYRQLPDIYYPQVRVVSDELDVFTCTLDFAMLEKNKVVYFIEMKSLSFDTFIELQSVKDKLSYIKKHFKSYYNQVQEQLFVTKLKSCTMMFVVVYDNNNDLVNWNRKFEKNEIINVVIPIDDNVVNKIKERGLFFQQIKDYLCQ